MPDNSKASQRSWISSSIAWLSVSIIAAAWGNQLLPDEWQNIWGGIGVFGLTAALGLASIAAAKHSAATTAARSTSIVDQQ